MELNAEQTARKLELKRYMRLWEIWYWVFFVIALLFTFAAGASFETDRPSIWFFLVGGAVTFCAVFVPLERERRKQKRELESLDKTVSNPLDPQ
ncbi:MAG: DUF368 domain-containing protein [Firmicutes bacterium]|nr:DUF368 domain-containing protein [Bacillota bacterium]